MNRNKYLLKNTLLIFLGNIGSKLIIFLLIPLYTAVLTTEQYGIIDLIFNIMMIALPIITLNMYESMLRFPLDQGADLDGIVSVGCCALIFSVITGAMLALTARASEPLSEYALYIFFYAVTMGFSHLSLYYLRGREMLLQYSTASILQTVLIAVSSVIFLVVFKGGIAGYLAAFSVSYLITSIYSVAVSGAWRVIPKRFHLNTELAKQMLRYSVVLMPSSFTWWIMNSSDRVMVAGMIGVSANAIYAVSYKLPTLVSIFTGIFNQAWGYSAIRASGSGDETEYNNSVLKELAFFVLLVAIVIITFSKYFLRFYVAEEYYEAWKYVPCLTAGLVFLALSGFMGTSYMLHKDSLGYLFSSIFGAAVNVSLNLLLIPQWGIHGAAFATGLSFFGMFLFRLYHTGKYLRYRIFSGEFISGCAVMITVSLLAYTDGYAGLAVQLLLLFFYAVMGRNHWIPALAGLYHRYVQRRTKIRA